MRRVIPLIRLLNINTDPVQTTNKLSNQGEAMKVIIVKL
jgi:hypothetical protein